MATPNFTGTAYPGKQVMELVHEVLQENTLIKNAGARLVPGFKSKMVVHEYESDITLKAYTCEMDGTDVGTVNSRVVDLCPVAVDPKGCNDDLVGTWYEGQLAAGTLNERTMQATDVWDVIVADVTEKFASGTNDMLINGDKDLYPSTNSRSLCDGLIKKLEANKARLNHVSGTTITTSNVVAEIAKMRLLNDDTATIVGSVDNNGDTVQLYISPVVYEMLYQAYILDPKCAWVGVDPTTGKLNMWMGMRIVVITNWPKDKMLITFPKNIQIGMDSEDDSNVLRITNNAEADAHKNTWSAVMAARLAVDVRTYPFCIFYS